MTGVAGVTDSSFDDDVLKSHQLVLLEFWARWCTPSRALSPVVNRIAADYAGRVKVLRVDVDESPILSRQYCSNPPVLCLFKNGIMVDTITGVVQDGMLRRTLDKHL